MSSGELIALIDRLRALPTETEWFEFKRNRYEPQELGEYLSALANAACLSGQPRGYLVFGIDNATHDVVGTQFDPYAAKGKGNQDLLPWLAAGLRPNTGFEVHVVEHPDGRVVLFEIGPANGPAGQLLRHGVHPRRHQQDRAGQAPREGAGALDARQRLVGGGLRAGDAGRPRSGGRGQGARAVRRQAPGPGQRGGRLGRHAPSSTRPGS